MDCEFERAYSLDYCDAVRGFKPLMEAQALPLLTPESKPDDVYCDIIVDVDLGKSCSDQRCDIWKTATKRGATMEV